MSSLSNPKPKRIEELDGLRALAVAAVILFHCDIAGLCNAGFFGVDIFFAISGFIISTILLDEYRQRGHIRFGLFYFRRLKRILPPVLVVIAVAFPVTATLSDQAYALLKTDALAAASYASNWWQIHAEQSYFDTTPHVLKHLWSLAVEEQFYLVWPLLAYWLFKTLGMRRTAAVGALLALAGTVWMGYMFIAVHGENRIYLGTDTHVMGLLAGAALACGWNARVAITMRPQVRFGARVAALVALGLLAYMIMAMNAASLALYQGAFLLVPVLACILIFCTVTDPAFFLSIALRLAPVQWLGKRSYSLYLVHWPVFVWLRLAGHHDFSHWLVAVTALLAVGVLAAWLYRWVEAPSANAALPLPVAVMWLSTSTYTVAAIGLFAITWQAWDEDKAAALATANIAAVVAANQPKAPAPVSNAPAAVEPEALIDAGEKISGGADIFAVGDSVLKGASPYLAKTIPGIVIDAEVGRQASEGLKVVHLWLDKPHQAHTVLVHLGTNGYINESQFKELLGSLAGIDHVLVMNVHAERRWTTANNALIARLGPTFSNVKLIDWNAVSAHHDDFFVKDGIHLTGRGMRALTAQIKLATGGEVIEPAPPRIHTVAHKATAPGTQDDAVQPAATEEPAPAAAVPLKTEQDDGSGTPQ